jgi:hypothetical protein
MVRYFRRLAGAILLDVRAYEEVEADSRATLHACITVILCCLSAGVGARGFAGAGAGSMSVLPLTAMALVGWASWSLLTFEIGARLLPGARTHADVGELMRTLGFAASPGLFLAAGALPGMGRPVFAMVSLWMLVAMVVAVRQALDYASTMRAIAVCVAGWALSIAIVLGVGFLLGTSVS